MREICLARAESLSFTKLCRPELKTLVKGVARNEGFVSLLFIMRKSVIERSNIGPFIVNHTSKKFCFHVWVRHIRTILSPAMIHLFPPTIFQFVKFVSLIMLYISKNLAGVKLVMERLALDPPEQ